MPFINPEAQQARWQALNQQTNPGSVAGQLGQAAVEFGNTYVTNKNAQAAAQTKSDQELRKAALENAVKEGGLKVNGPADENVPLAPGEFDIGGIRFGKGEGKPSNLQNEMVLAQFKHNLEAPDRAQKAAELKNQKDEQQVTKYTNDVEKAGLPELQSQLATLDAELKKYKPGEDIPGYGKTGFIPTALLSESGKSMRNAVSGLQNAILKARSGGAVTPSEADRMLQEIGTYSGGSDKALVEGLSRTSERLKNVVKNFETRDPNVVGIYKSRGGPVTSQNFPTLGYQQPSTPPIADAPPLPSAADVRAVIRQHAQKNNSTIKRSPVISPAPRYGSNQ